jgi:hypothetical protein
MSNRPNDLRTRAGEVARYLEQNPIPPGRREPRVPIGHGRESGEWTTGGGNAAPPGNEYKPDDPEKYFGIMEPAVRDAANRLGIQAGY